MKERDLKKQQLYPARKDNISGLMKYPAPCDNDVKAQMIQKLSLKPNQNNFKSFVQVDRNVHSKKKTIIK